MNAVDPCLPVQALRYRLGAAGYRPVAVYNATRGDKATGKAPAGKAWQDRARLDPPEASIRPATPEALNTGLLCDGLRAIDIDIDDSETAVRVRDFVEEVFGETIARTRADSGRCLLVYRAAEGEPVKRVLNGSAGKVEILGRGQQFVAHGLHYASLARLEWLNGSPEVTPRDSLPAVTEGQIDALLIALAGFIGADIPATDAHGAAADDFARLPSSLPTADPQDVAAALAVIPNDGPADWEAWNRVLMAAWAATGGSSSGLAAAMAWSERHPEYKAKETVDRWNHFAISPPTAIGAGTLFHMAQEARPGWRKPTLQVSAAPAPRPAGGIRLLSPAECQTANGRRYLVKGIIAERDLVCLFGAPGAGKSIIAPHLAYAVAQGRPAFGRRVRAGGVFYVAAEDALGMRQRVTGLKLTHGDASAFSLVEGVGSLLDDEQADDLRALVAEHRPALIVVDTVAMAWPGIDENTSHDMGRVVAVARSLTEHGAAVVLIHHDTKAADGTPRGHSLLNGALDVSLQLGKADDNGIIRGKLVKNRNGACDVTVAFRIRSVMVGQDEDGDDITTPVCDELSDVAAPVAEKMPRAAAAALSILSDMVEANAGQPVPETAWRDACDDKRISTAEDKDGRGKAFRRAYALLLDRKAVEGKGGCVSVAAARCADFPADISDISDIVRVCPPGKTAGQTGHFGHGSIDHVLMSGSGMPRTALSDFEGMLQ